MMKREITYLVMILAVTMIMAGCGKAGRTEKDSATPVKVMKVRLEGIDKTLEYVGNIKGQDEAIVYPKVSGKVVEKVREDGSLVKKGDPIAYIDRDEVGLKFEKAPVESPLAGVVGRVYVDIGSSVTQATPIAQVSDIDKVEIDLDIPEKYLPHVSAGQDADVFVDAYPDSKFPGKVTRVSPLVDLATRTAPIEIVIDNADHRLQSGMFANVDLVIENNKSVPVILKEAVIGKAPDTYVFVAENNKAYLRKVTLGIRQGPYYEVLGGLKEGESVVVMGQQRLKDGASVTAEE